MFIPVGHDQSTVRRLPWVTFSIMGLCVLAFLLTLGGVESAGELANRRLSEVAEYYFMHPDLEIEPEIEEYFYGFVPEHQGQREALKEVMIEASRGFGLTGGEEKEESREEQQQTLNELVDRFHEAVASFPYFRWGLVPAQQTAHAYITYQFMHGGWMHLLFNMLFLYLAGPYLEDVWGRPIFTGFYLFAGVFAALVYVLKYPLMEGPLVGASGAIAGLMGGFLVRYSGTKIRFLYFFFFRPKTFGAPAWVMLPLWLLREVFYGQAVDMGGGQGAGVAHWAHVAGFVFGVVAAFAIKKLDVEERFVEKALEAKSVLHEDLELEEALEAHRTGDSRRAEEILRTQLAADPGNFEAAAAYWDVARDRGDIEPAFPHMLKVLKDALRKGDLDLVEIRWEEVLEFAPQGKIEPVLAARVAETLGDRFSESTLASTIAAGLAGAVPGTATGVLVRLARVGAKTRSPATRQLIERALEGQDLLPETRTELEEMRSVEARTKVASAVVGGAAVESFGDSSPAPIGDAPEVQYLEPVTVVKIDHSLKVMEADPLAWSDGRLTIDVQGTVRPLGAHHLEAVAVAGIAAPDQGAFVLVDLMLDAPWSDRRNLRTVRLRSNAFDPRKLIPSESSQTSFKLFLEDILSASGAVPLPDPDAAVGNPFARFSSVGEYEKEVLGTVAAKAVGPIG